MRSHESYQMKKIILAIGTHPDDIEIGCGGTLALLTSQGHEVNHLIITSGEEGKQFVTKEALKLIRESEAKQSARVLGSSRVLFFGAPDGLTSFSKEMKVQLIKILREIRPDVVFTHGASDHFPDHQIVHQMTMSSLLAAQGPWYSESPLAPHQVSEVYGYEVWNPISKYQLAINISSVMKLKLEALQAHSSQTSEVDYLGAVSGLAQYRGATSMCGKFAEVFEILKGTL